MTQGQISIAQNTLTIQNLSVSDAPTVSYIAGFDSADQTHGVINALQLGVRVSQYAADQITTTSLCDQIEASADTARKLLTEVSRSTNERITEKMDGVFGKNGVFDKSVNAQLATLQRELEGKLDPDKATSITAKLRSAVRKDVNDVLTEVRKELNLADPKSAVGLLRADLDSKLKDVDAKVTQLVQQQAVRSAVSIEKFRGSAKGTTFELALHPVLDALCRPRHDHVEYTGAEPGLNGRSKRGDFVIELDPRAAGGKGLKIVVEAKNDATRYSQLLRELDEAMDNRGASYAIGICTHAGVLPPGSPPIVFPSSNKAVIVLSDYDTEDETFESIAIEVGLEAARHIAIGTRDQQTDPLNIVKVYEQVKEAINGLGSLTEVRKRLTSIVNTAKDADTLVERMRTEIRASLQAIRDSLDDQLSETETDLRLDERKSA